ncbi:MAG: sirohydrochlorin chelatase, partial [Propionibacteriaceae bacterium]|nr:sirohydrochlorin chelatase [Propionibacteriaceae bacterium]
MAAPALVLLSRGSTDHRVSEVIHQLKAGLQKLRPDLVICAAFLNQGPSTASEVMMDLVGRGVNEVV